LYRDESRERQKVADQKADKTIKLRPIFVVFACIWGGTTMYGLGKIAAIDKKFFLKTFEADGTQYALVANYGDLAIAIKLENGKLARGQSVVFNIGESHQIHFKPAPPPFRFSLSFKEEQSSK
jgi:hypothetical protein